MKYQLFKTSRPQIEFVNHQQMFSYITDSLGQRLWYDPENNPDETFWKTNILLKYAQV